VLAELDDDVRMAWLDRQRVGRHLTEWLDSAAWMDGDCTVEIAIEEYLCD
jgi:hypothetical protein